MSSSDDGVVINHFLNSLFPNADIQPLFKCDEEYRLWLEAYTASVSPLLDVHRIARLKSEHESMFRLVG